MSGRAPCSGCGHFLILRNVETASDGTRTLEYGCTYAFCDNPIRRTVEAGLAYTEAK